MNKKILSAMLSVAILFAAGSAFVSCKDYDDDIKNLQTQIDGLKQTIETIQSQIAKGYLLTAVNQTAGGVTITLSDGKTYTINNGKDGAAGADGKDGDVWTIGDDGYWYKNGTKTEYKAKGDKGEKGEKGEQGEQGPAGPQGPQGASGGQDGKDGCYYVPKEDGYFWKVDPTTGTETKTDVKWSNQGGTGNPVVNAAWDSNSNVLTLSGLVDSNGNVTSVTIPLAGQLTSLVFKPYYYFDGIETIIYPWLQDTVMTQPTNPTKSFTRQRASETEIKTINLLGLIPSINDENTNTIDWWGNYYPDGGDRHDYLPDSYLFNYGIPTTVDYHKNPVNASVTYADIQGWSVLTPEVIYYNTRAAAAADFSSPEKDFGGNQLFNVSNDGVLRVGLQIANPQNLNPYPTLDKFNDPANKKNNNTVALKVNTEEGIVTSDYALIYPEKYYIEGLAYQKYQTYTKINKNAHGAIISTEQKTSNYAARVNDGTARKGDQEGTWDKAKVHVWDTPIEALKDPDGAALELLYDADEGITLRDFLEIHLVKDNVNSLLDDDITYKKSMIKLNCATKEEEKYGLKLEFKLVNYQIAGNVSRDSKYAEMADNYNGKVIAWNVDWNASATGVTYKQHDRAAIDREPLVQVLVKNTKDEVVLDGYILLHICEMAPEQKPNKDIVYPAGAPYYFDLCNDGLVLATNWDQFSKIVLTDTLKGMTKDQFDEIYEVVKPTWSTSNYTADGYEFFEVEQYAAFQEKGVATPLSATQRLGRIDYYPNWQGTTNHVFRWTISAEELEALTHDQAQLPITVSRWVRYDITYATGASTLAPYPYIFVKLTATLDRQKWNNPYDTFGVKDDQYWYDFQTGATNGWSSVVADIQEPRDGQDIYGSFIYTFHESLVRNMENTSGTASQDQHGNNLHKYYFAPKDEVVTGKGPDGKTTSRTITAYHPTEQPNYNKLICKYTGDVHTWNEATLNSTLENCAIHYGEGAFNNKYLYSKNGNTYIKIAEINQKTGEITLPDVDHGGATPAEFAEAKLVLNLVGYEPQHGNINTELRTWCAVVSSNECCIAKPIVYDQTRDLFSYQVSWQRPINLKEIDNQYALDAHTNGNVIYMIDLLKLFDWRGDNVEGKMYDGQYWFWAYYMLNSITIDMDPAHIYTNMHYNDWSKTMADVTNLAELYAWPSGAKTAVTYNFGALINPYNRADKERQIESVMGINPENQTKKLDFGAIKYVNNGGNVDYFSVRIPIILEYYWGTIYDTIQIDIDATAGNH